MRIFGSAIKRLGASLESGDLVSGRLKTDALGGVLVADIFHSCLPADKEPLETSAYGFDDVPWVESIHESVNAKASAMISRLWIWKEACSGF